jgi:hypothetical protein
MNDDDGQEINRLWYGLAVIALCLIVWWTS